MHRFMMQPSNTPIITRIYHKNMVKHGIQCKNMVKNGLQATISIVKKLNYHINRFLKQPTTTALTSAPTIYRI